MRVIHDAQVEWHFWTALYPLLKQALPRIERLSADDRQSLGTENDVTTIRISFKKIPHQLRQPQLEQELDQAAFNSFLVALLSLLDIFENLVVEEVLQVDYEPRPFIGSVQTAEVGLTTHAEELSKVLATANQHPLKAQLRTRYPKLAILKETLQTLELDARALPLESCGEWKSPASYSNDVILEQARHIKFHSQNPPDYHSIAEQIRRFNLMVESIFKASLAASEGTLTNAALLRDDEIEFIQRADYCNSLSKSLFKFLAKSITCRKAHTTRIHLSGFLDPELNFDLLIAACTEQYWHFAKCRWFKFRHPSTFNSRR
jgi:hypothetical protein